MAKLWRFCLVAVGAALAGMLLSIGLSAPARSQAADGLRVAQAGGDTTIRNRTSHAYSQPAPNLNEEWLRLHLRGDRAFEAVFVTPPATVNAGLGPLYNNTSCVGCHIRDGRGMPEIGQLLVRVSARSPQEQVSPASAYSPPIAPVLRSDYHPEAAVSLGNAPPVPEIGTQIQDHGTYGFTPEAKVKLEWELQPGAYADGTPYELRSLRLAITRPNGESLSPDVFTSPRIPSPVFGLGLLEAVPTTAIEQQADPDDRNRDGISGRPNWVWDVVQGKPVVGRFGWKANNPDLLQQTAAAYVNDMGVTSPLFPETNGSSEISAEILQKATVYVQTLAVPARSRLNDPQVQRGEQLFSQTCAACHLPTLQTGNHEISALAQQTIHPYTDLLLHDMGTGLADGRPDFQALGSEWRTAPLWGIGLTQTVLPYSGFLHDGRARSLAEAILWHGGEAETAKEAFRTMSASDRTSLIDFLRSL